MMALEKQILDITFRSAANLANNQFYIVSLTSNPKEVNLANATSKPIGVLQNKPTAAGRAAQVRVAGTSKVVAGGTINVGDYVKSDANGKAIATTTNGDEVLGIALESAAANEIFEVLILRFRY